MEIDNDICISKVGHQSSIISILGGLLAITVITVLILILAMLALCMKKKVIQLQNEFRFKLQLPFKDKNNPDNSMPHNPHENADNSVIMKDNAAYQMVQN